MTPFRILLVEDEDDDAELLRRAVQRAGLEAEFRRVLDLPAFVEALSWNPDVVVADYALPQFSAQRAVEYLTTEGIDIPLVVVSGTVGEETAVALMRAGAADCVMKAGLSRLGPALERVVRDAGVRRRQRVIDERIRRYAWTDEETGLPNRNRLLEQLREAQARPEGVVLGVLTLERGSDVQRTLGHRVVDQMVVGLARRLARVASGGGWFVARIAPRDFAVCLPATDEHAVEDLVRELDHVDVFGSLTLDVRSRAGFVRATPGEDPTELVRHAEAAVEQAMRTGKRLVWYSPAADPWSPRRLALLNDLGYAVARGELNLVCQPRIDLHTRRTRGFEALLRWRHPTLGRVPPDEFIPLAEGTGQIHALTDWVVDAAARLVAGWRDSGLDLSLGVNVSARSLTDADLVGDLKRVLHTHALSPEALDVEVTETALMSDPARARSVLTELRELGIRTFLDDFGSGYSSLGYLRNLPLHALKIDRVFVTGGLETRADVSIVQATIQLAHNLGLAVVAEGVETGETLDRLAGLGCDEAQGYHIARPLAPEAVPGWLANSGWGVAEGDA